VIRFRLALALLALATALCAAPPLIAAPPAAISSALPVGEISCAHPAAGAAASLAPPEALNLAGPGFTLCTCRYCRIHPDEECQISPDGFSILCDDWLRVFCP